MKYFVIIICFIFIRLISGNQFESSANVSDTNGENYVIQKRFGFLKNLFQPSDDYSGATVIIDRRFRQPKRKRWLRKCLARGRRYRRPIIERKNFEVALNNVPHGSRYLNALPEFKQPPDDTYHYSFPNGLLDGNNNVNMFEPAPGDLLYPPMTPIKSPNDKFNLQLNHKGPKLYPFYEHEAVNLLHTRTMSNNVDDLYRRDNGMDMKRVYNKTNNILPPKSNNHKITIVTPSPVDKNILTLSKLINDRRKKTIYNNHHQQQQQQQHQHPKFNSQENLLKFNLINNLKTSRSNKIIPLRRTSNNASSRTALRSHQSNYHHYPATNSNNNNDQYRYDDASDPIHNTKTIGNDHNNHYHYHDTYNLQNARTHNKTTLLMNDGDRMRLLYTIDDKVGVQDDHPMMDQVNDERNYLKIYNIEPNYNWVNVDTKTALGNTLPSPQKYSSSIPATDNPMKAYSVIDDRAKIY